jgi:hypothetical protein
LKSTTICTHHLCPAPKTPSISAHLMPTLTNSYIFTHVLLSFFRMLTHSQETLFFQLDELIHEATSSSSGLENIIVFVVVLPPQRAAAAASQLKVGFKVDVRIQWRQLYLELHCIVHVCVRVRGIKGLEETLLGSEKSPR